MNDYIVTLIRRRKKSIFSFLRIEWSLFVKLSIGDTLCQVWLKLAQWFWRRRFLNVVNVFSLFRNYPHPPHGKALGPSFEQTLAQRFWRRFLIFVNVFSLFCYHLPLDEGSVHYLNKFESPLPKDAMCQVWLKFGWNWSSGSREEDQCIFVISLFRYYLPSGKGVALHLKTLIFFK